MIGLLYEMTRAPSLNRKANPVRICPASGDRPPVDLLDALPLAGRGLVSKALAREFGNQRQFDAGVLEGCDGSEQLAKLILHGENYVAMSLCDGAQEYFATRAETWPTGDQG